MPESPVWSKSSVEQKGVLKCKKCGTNSAKILTGEKFVRRFYAVLVHEFEHNVGWGFSHIVILENCRKLVVARVIVGLIGQLG